MATNRSKRSTTQPPSGLNLQRFAESRAPELESLHSIIADRQNNDFRSRRNKRRRTTAYNNRAASSGSSRCRKRQKKLGVVDVVDSEKGKKEKKVPRHIRRRAELKKNPEAFFCTSGDGTKRLRTHVWHAKRFTMTKLWGFHLPLGLQGRGRGSRALLKWFNQGVLVHDASYHVAVQLEGPEDSLLSILQMVLVTPMSLHSEDTDSVLSGLTYGSAMLHQVGAPVSQPIAPVTYMWRSVGKTCKVNDAKDCMIDGCNEEPIIEACSLPRQVWVWIHASAIEEGYNSLKFACQKEMDEKGTSISCFSLEGQIAKLEVMGLKAYQHLLKILHPVTSISEDSCQFSECSVKTANGDSQVKKFIFESEEHVSSHAILSLTVKDPRTCHPKGIGDVLESDSTSMLTDVPENEAKEHASSSGISDKNVESLPEENSDLYDSKDLWDARGGISPPVEEYVLCAEKHQRNVDFFCLDQNSGMLNASAEVQCARSCPILLLKNDDKKGSVLGWSVVLPLSWVRAFWVPLVSRGAHVIGLREKHWIAYEVGLPYFPWDFPDCKAYSCLMATEAAASDQRAELRPPVVRPFRVPFPPPWHTVWSTIGKGHTEAENTHISNEKVCIKDMVIDQSLLHKCEIQDIKSMLDGGDHGIRLLDYQSNPFEVNVARTSATLTSYLNTINGIHLLLFPRVSDRKICFAKLMDDAFKLSQSQHGSTQIKYDHKLFFLRVVLHAHSKGVFEEGAVVCAPQLSDISSRSDINCGKPQMSESSVRSYFKEQPDGKWELQVPEDPVAREAHRWPIGFVTTGCVRGSKKAGAQAFCAATLLSRLRQDQWNEFPAKRRKKEIYVLVRNLRSSAYRLALATIVMEQQKEDLEFM